MTSPPSLSDCTLLYLEDEILIALDTAETLRETGLERVHAVHTLADANTVLDAEKVDLAVLDINLGRGDTSFDIARRVRESGGQVVFATGYTDHDIPDDLSDLPVLIKPVMPRLLMETLEATLKAHARFATSALP